MVDKTLILRKFVSLDEYFKQIEEYSNISINDYANNWKTQRIIDRTLQMMIETCQKTPYHKQIRDIIFKRLKGYKFQLSCWF